MPFSLHNAAAVPTACPITAQVAITRVEPKTICDTLIALPPKNKLSILTEYQQRYGIEYMYFVEK